MSREPREGVSKEVLKFFSGSNNSMVEANGNEPVAGKKIILKGQERKLPKEDNI